MEHTKSDNINIFVEDEKNLYSKFSAYDFDDSAKNFIKSKKSVKQNMQNLSLTVNSKQPINEERFLAAVSNWTNDEKALFKANEQNTIYKIIALLIFGSLMIVLSIIFQKYFKEVQYSILPIIGSFSLSRAVGMLIIDIPENRAKRWVINKMEQKNAITFVYDSNEETSSSES